MIRYIFYYNIATLRPTQGVCPVLAQACNRLTGFEHATCVANCKPPHASDQEVSNTRFLSLKSLQLLLARNLYVQDFASLSEMDAVPEGKIVINAEAQTVCAQPHQYNFLEGDTCELSTTTARSQTLR